MNERIFDRPVFVRERPFIVREVASLDDALDFLDHWPEADRGLIYQTAWKACCDVFDGHKPLPVARHAFEGFAKRAGILEDADAVLPWMGRGKGSSGRTSV
ncbi:DUF982 domain-containing protein [Phyllobacterium sp. 21LDTY02-6]|uniref:DUF982 domain-containing protein n=1 Tax=unclassified Phyllobacterium TaxID=2638441 RepID=UPI0020203094|nr:MULTISPECIES: DUF982 domain-containing protein [unclassified Phyllobacterium]MCO4318002.1 DUF982 domain-containing protein [Phyllobacterium sp. 21LDTY02-6]MCX8282555.1 DUF982 domain-containing protein [Phyllobacterium sp. 0TCS1.6C]MCX8296391.1 DUF982 domain-containing protein [Phyllobacterium sp. 0TCS1.6A]